MRRTGKATLNGVGIRGATSKLCTYWAAKPLASPFKRLGMTLGEKSRPVVLMAFNADYLGRKKKTAMSSKAIAMPSRIKMRMRNRVRSRISRTVPSPTSKLANR